MHPSPSLNSSPSTGIASVTSLCVRLNLLRNVIGLAARDESVHEAGDHIHMGTFQEKVRHGYP